ncbi:hypothetical protein VTH06DRAFT_2545 [Thermothelomyces fergusii]
MVNEHGRRTRRHPASQHSPRWGDDRWNLASYTRHDCLVNQTILSLQVAVKVDWRERPSTSTGPGQAGSRKAEDDTSRAPRT